jgi:uncharacterized RDD family membrane protein YckC
MNYKELLRPRMTKVVQDAGFLRRLCSFVADILVLDLIITAPFTPLFSSLISRAGNNGFHMTYTRTEITAIVFLFLVVYLYFVLFEYLLGQTFGMMLANTRLAGNDGLGAILVRNSFILPVFPFILLWILEPLMVLFRKRSILEQVTKTRTIYQREVAL